MPITRLDNRQRRILQDALDADQENIKAGRITRDEYSRAISSKLAVQHPEKAPWIVTPAHLDYAVEGLGWEKWPSNNRVSSNSESKVQLKRIDTAMGLEDAPEMTMRTALAAIWECIYLLDNNQRIPKELADAIRPFRSISIAKDLDIQMKLGDDAAS